METAHLLFTKFRVDRKINMMRDCGYLHVHVKFVCSFLFIVYFVFPVVIKVY